MTILDVVDQIMSILGGWDQILPAKIRKPPLPHPPPSVMFSELFLMRDTVRHMHAFNSMY